MTPLYFGRNTGEKPPLPYALVTPRDARWNDFGRNYHAELEIKLQAAVGDDEAFVCRALVMPVNWNDLEKEDRFDTWVDRHLSKGKNYFLFDPQAHPGEKPAFVTLLQGESAYRELSMWNRDPQTRIDLLLMLNDLVLITNEKVLPQSDVTALLQSENFTLGCMRSGSAYQALHRGGRHIWASAHELLQDAREAFRFRCHLRGFEDDPHTLTVRYEDSPVLEDRVHCLVGKNGCGKTRILKELVLALAASAEGQNGPTSFLDNDESSARQPSEFDGPPFRRVLCFSLDAHSSFPTGTRNDAKFEYIFSNLNEGKPQTQEEASRSLSANITRLLVDITRNDDTLDVDGGKSRLTLFIQALKPYLDQADVFLPLQADAPTNSFVIQDDAGCKWISLRRLRTAGEKRTLARYAQVDLEREIRFQRDGDWVDLSSGHRVFFNFALSFLSYIDTGTLVIMDEPETHLHPNLVCDFMNLIYQVLRATKSVALIATHSAYVVREVPTHCAHVYVVEDGIPSENQVYLRTLGANIDNISQAVFGDSNADRFHQQIARELAKGKRSVEALVNDYANLLSPDLLSQVVRLMDKEQAGGDDEDV